MAPATSAAAALAFATLLAPAGAFVAPATCSGARTTSMSLKSHPTAAAAAAAVVLGGSFFVTLPANAAVQDAASAVQSVNVNAAKDGIAGAASDIADTATSAIGNPQDSPAFQEGANVQRRGAEANIDKARNTVSNTVRDVQRAQSSRDVGSGSSGGSPSKWNPAGFPTFADGVRKAKSGTKDNAGRVGEAVEDAQRGVTQRDGAVDALKDNARASAPYFGKLANDGVNRMSNPGGN